MLAKPYGNLLEHIADRLKRLDLHIRGAIARHPRERPADWLSFAAITDSEVDSLLRREPDDERPAEGEDTPFDRHVEQRVAATLATKGRLPLLELSRMFGLSALEADTLVACLAVEIDRKYERIYGYLHDDMSRKLPSAGVILSLFASGDAHSAARSEAFGSQAPLLRYQLLHPAEEASANLPICGKGLRLDERIVAFLLGDRSIDSRIADCVSFHAPGARAAALTASQLGSVDAMLGAAGGLANQAVGARKPVFYLHGPPNGGADMLTHEAARRLGLPLLAVDAERLAAMPGGFRDGAFLLLRECLLAQAAAYVRRVDRVLDQDRSGQQCTILLQQLAEMAGIAFLSGERPWSWTVPAEPLALLPVELRALSYGEQLAVWRSFARSGAAQFGEEELHELVSKHPLSAADIDGVFRMARSFSALRGPQAELSAHDLGRACRSRSSIDFGGVARRIEPRQEWDDIVLPAGQMEQLRSICSQARRRSKVYGEWGFDRKLTLGRGLNALFTGPPGTGKTMAAEVIARELGLSLYKIDLSQTVSKYIGETEKNLSRVFDQAAAAHAILFFDEADALLGKRSEVKDAHDRYANTEVAYLLQKIEEYEGVSILATNLRQNMDEAFTRRMRFVVEFPFPDEAARRGIWQRAFPREAPLAAGVDAGFLASRFKLAGGSIRNIALGAAFLAAERRRPIDMELLIESGKLELRKMGRLVNDAEYVRPAAATP
jgi:hypothetical protein